MLLERTRDASFFTGFALALALTNSPSFYLVTHPRPLLPHPCRRGEMSCQHHPLPSRRRLRLALLLRLLAVVEAEEPCNKRKNKK